MVGAVTAAASSTKSPTDFDFQVTGEQFLQLFLSELQNQNPLEPMTNADMMGQISQITNLQMMKDLSTTVGRLANDNPLLLASSMLGKSVEYVNGFGSTSNSLVQDVHLDEDNSIILGLTDGTSLKMNEVIRLAN